MKLLSVAFLFAISAGVLADCGCLKCGNNLRVVSPPNSPLTVVYRGEYCHCPKPIPYRIEVPNPPCNSCPSRTYGYSVKAMRVIRPRDPVLCSHGFQVQVPKVQCKECKYLYGLVAKPDRVVMPAPDECPPPRKTCHGPIIEYLPKNQHDCDYSEYIRRKRDISSLTSPQHPTINWRIILQPKPIRLTPIARRFKHFLNRGMIQNPYAPDNKREMSGTHKVEDINNHIHDNLRVNPYVQNNKLIEILRENVLQQEDGSSPRRFDVSSLRKQFFRFEKAKRKTLQTLNKHRLEKHPVHDPTREETSRDAAERVIQNSGRFKEMEDVIFTSVFREEATPKRSKRSYPFEDNSIPFYQISTELGKNGKSTRENYSGRGVEKEKRPYLEPFDVENILPQNQIFYFINFPIRALEHFRKLKDHVSPIMQSVPKVMNTSSNYLVHLGSRLKRNALELLENVMESFNLPGKPFVKVLKPIRRNKRATSENKKGTLGVNEISITEDEITPDEEENTSAKEEERIPNKEMTSTIEDNVSEGVEKLSKEEEGVRGDQLSLKLEKSRLPIEKDSVPKDKEKTLNKKITSPRKKQSILKVSKPALNVEFSAKDSKLNGAVLHKSVQNSEELNPNMREDVILIPLSQKTLNQIEENESNIKFLNINEETNKETERFKRAILKLVQPEEVHRFLQEKFSFLDSIDEVTPSSEEVLLTPVTPEDIKGKNKEQPKLILEKLSPKLFLNKVTPSSDSQKFKKSLKSRIKKSHKSHHDQYSVKEEINDLIEEAKQMASNSVAKKAEEPSEIPLQTVKNRIKHTLEYIQILVHVDFKRNEDIYEELLRMENLKKMIIDEWRTILDTKKYNDINIKINLLNKMEELLSQKEDVVEAIAECLTEDSKNFNTKNLIKILVRLQKLQCVLGKSVEEFGETIKYSTPVDVIKELKHLEILNQIDLISAKNHVYHGADLRKQRDHELEKEVTLLDNLKGLLECEICENKANRINEVANILWEIKNAEKLQLDTLVEMHEKIQYGMKIRRELKIVFDLEKHLETCCAKQKALFDDINKEKLTKLLEATKEPPLVVTTAKYNALLKLKSRNPLFELFKKKNHVAKRT